MGAWRDVYLEFVGARLRRALPRARVVLLCAPGLALLGAGSQPPVFQFVIEGDTQTWSRVVAERAQ